VPPVDWQGNNAFYLSGAVAIGRGLHGSPAADRCSAKTNTSWQCELHSERALAAHNGVISLTEEPLGTSHASGKSGLEQSP
jgi:hypothetical protein